MTINPQIEEKFDLEDVYAMNLEEQDEFSAAIAEKVEELVKKQGRTLDDVENYGCTATVLIQVWLK